jgi:hypothetical protein
MWLYETVGYDWGFKRQKRKVEGRKAAEVGDTRRNPVDTFLLKLKTPFCAYPLWELTIFDRARGFSF